MKITKLTKMISLVLVLTFTCTYNTYPLPNVEEVVSGEANIEYTDPTTMVIEASDNAIVNYSSFDIMENETVVVKLPSVDSEILNRVLGDSASQLMGGLSCNGVFILVNPSGIYVGPAANIDAAGLILSTRDILNSDFLSGNHLFQKITEDQAEKLLLNEGDIKIHDGGFGVLIAGAIENKGIITAPIGKIVLASGDAVKLDISGGGLISVAIDKKVASGIKDYEGNPITDQIKSTGTIDAEGGVVILKAESIGEIFTKAINLEGFVRANTVNIDTDGAVVSLGTLEAETLTEKGASCLLGGKTVVGDSLFENLDGALTLAGSIAGVYNDVEDIELGGNVNMTGDTTLNADSDADNDGFIDMEGNDLAGGGFDLTLFAGEDSALDGDITNVGLLELNSSNTADIEYESDNTKAFSVDTVRSNYHAELVREVGAGTMGDPYLIFDINGLQAVDDDDNAHYKLANNIDAIATEDWNGGQGFEPIGGDFEGSFDGNNKTISNFTIDRPFTYYVGLFAQTDEAAWIKDLTLEGNVTGGRYVGALVGRNEDTPITNVHTNAEVIGDYGEGNADYVGGLIGYNEDGSTITNCSAQGDVSSTGDYVGGLIGHNEGSTITGSNASGDVSGDDCVGGLVGGNFEAEDTIINCYATGAVEVYGEYGGGLVGRNVSSSITDSHATGKVEGMSYDYQFGLGGLVGGNENSSTITNCYATGEVLGDYAQAVGGLVGYNYGGTITDSHATGKVRGGEYIGGLVGQNYEAMCTIIRSYATGDVYGPRWLDGGNYAGGLIGYNYASPIIDCYAIGNVYFDQDYAGGLVGYNEYGDITCCHATGDVLPNVVYEGYDPYYCDRDYRGGLVGYCEDSTVESSYATGKVKGYRYVGGLVGSLGSSDIRHSGATGEVFGDYDVGGLVGHASYSDIRRSYAKGNINTPGQTAQSGSEGTIFPLVDEDCTQGEIGGLIGYNYETSIRDCYAQGNVNGDNNVGGFIGYGYTSSSYNITRCYSTGEVTGNWNVGGFVGYENYGGPYSSCYWLQTPAHNAGLQDSGDPGDLTGVTAKNNTEMQQEATFEGWDFLGLWTVGSYPHLVWEDMLVHLPDGGVGCEGPDACYFLIHNVNELQFMKYALDASFKLANDIDASATKTWNPYGYNCVASLDLNGQNGQNGQMFYLGFEPIGDNTGDDDETGPFTGFFCGDCYTISNLYINRPYEENVGLFGLLVDATVGKVDLVNADITGDTHVGALAGDVQEESRILGCSSGGVVRGEYNVGGLVGRLNDSEIYCSHSTADVKHEEECCCLYRFGGLVGKTYNSEITRSYATGDVFGSCDGTYFGGLVGYNDRTPVADCYATGDVTVQSGWAIGGLFGLNENGGYNGGGTATTNCYSTGEVITSSSAGGFVGYDYGGPYSSCYWLQTPTHNAGLDDSDSGDLCGIDAKDDSQMKQQSTFACWDFENIWMPPQGAPPMLRECRICGEEPPTPVVPEPPVAGEAPFLQLNWTQESDSGQNAKIVDAPMLEFPVPIAALGDDMSDIVQLQGVGFGPGKKKKFDPDAFKGEVQVEGNTAQIF